MKFFLPHLHEGVPGYDDAFAAYEKHWRTVRHFLPDTVIVFEAAQTLYDAFLEAHSIDAGGTLELVFRGWDPSFSQARRHVLRFPGLRTFATDGEPPAVLEALGDVRHWEWNWTGDALELRLLFDAGSEWQVIADDFAALSEFLWDG